MEIGNIIPHIEALIFASDKPLTSMEITELINNAFGFMEEKLTLEQIQTSIDGIREKYASEFYPFEVRESGGGWQFLTKKDFHKTVAQLNGEKFLKRLSSAALETLAIVAYKQPITKGEIEAIRGVSSDYSIQKLLEKELIIISGRNEDMPGKPLVYSTSKTFMDYFGINSAADLPKLKEVFAETLVEPTLINHTPKELLPMEEAASEELTEDEKAQLIVTENGELLIHEEIIEEVTVTDETPDHAEPDEPSDIEPSDIEPEDTESEDTQSEDSGSQGTEPEDGYDDSDDSDTPEDQDEDHPDDDPKKK
ncbi:SMC-Scp complex subunit ScpB [Flavitalea sp. BT771]|uniref:SMC-Scp complex subunit ScpB n=1 Tax=Flavitalea sp. BT771 TaxID=3063329 RepID=UPI0026E2A0C9|nr:SMC-Scp complex subunit ScpB [Flavitalea sp. BT771]MDO6429437.1 SMC-Scp complex subunit ScpB [Flavitalea sp. BT771]MDV6218435.1 SMC-Scp complex subunit ScpB [Flavitalea sp. BT771]